MENENILYVTFDPASGSLTGAYLQALRQEHAECHIIVEASQYERWTAYRANDTRDGVELLPQVDSDLAVLKAAKNAEINAWRAAANLSTFSHIGKLIACDTLSRSDIDGVANHIALFGVFPAGFPGGWKTIDNAIIPLSDVDAFRAMYASMTAQGTANFNHSQELKLQLLLAQTPEDVASITW